MYSLNYIAKKYNLDLGGQSPIDIFISRNELGPLFAELGFTKGAEIGVERGIFSEILLKANPKLTLYCVDPWKAYKAYREHISQAGIDEAFSEAVERLKPYNCWIIKKMSSEACKDFPDNSLNFVYIDGNHTYDYTKEDLTNWIPKVKKGGIVAGHDFVRYGGKYGQYNRVKEAVSNYVKENNIVPFFRLNFPRERSSWMWIKQ